VKKPAKAPGQQIAKFEMVLDPPHKKAWRVSRRPIRKQPKSPPSGAFDLNYHQRKRLMVRERA
jgi:hypothetical protein